MYVLYFFVCLFVVELPTMFWLILRMTEFRMPCLATSLVMNKLLVQLMTLFSSFYTFSTNLLLERLYEPLLISIILMKNAKHSSLRNDAFWKKETMCKNTSPALKNPDNTCNNKVFLIYFFSLFSCKICFLVNCLDFFCVCVLKFAHCFQCILLKSDSFKSPSCFDH